MQIERYTSKQHQAWDDFVTSSKNATFLFYRDYMDYHQDRFDDHSLMFYDNGKLIALFPANQNAERLDSHGGLTYGGFLTNEHMKTTTTFKLFQTLIPYAQEVDFKHIRYKTIPHIYHHAPAEEDLYALHLIGAELIDRNVITAVNMKNRLSLQKRRERGAKKAHKAGFVVSQSDDLEAYWHILGTVLSSIHDATPVHSLSEITDLQQKFPENIKLYLARKDDEIVAGVLIYESDTVARSQYIASDSRGRNFGALDLIFKVLLDIYKDKSFFDFGTSASTDTADGLNRGLIEQKEGFGARATMHDIYQIDLSTATIKVLDKVQE